MASPYGMNYGVQFGRAVVNRMGARWTPQKAAFFRAWAQAEGTKAAYNPFATTRGGYAGETRFNEVGVKNFKDVATGIQATYDTINNGYYDNIVALLRKDNVTAQQLAEAVANSPWGTGTGVLRVLGVADADSYEKAKSRAKYGENRVAVEQQYAISHERRTLDALRPSSGYLQFLNQDEDSAVGRLVSNWRPFSYIEEVKTPIGTVPDTSGGPADTGEPSGFQGKGYTGGFKGDVWVLPTRWKHTHPTSGLGGSGWEGAQDLFPGRPGTPIGAPESGTIIAWDPQGAQGGGRIRFRSDSGYEYWIGHIDNGLGVGTHVKRGQPIAVVSSHHANPHVHIDRRRIGKKKGK